MATHCACLPKSATALPSTLREATSALCLRRRHVAHTSHCAKVTTIGAIPISFSVSTNTCRRIRNVRYAFTMRCESIRQRGRKLTLWVWATLRTTWTPTSLFSPGTFPALHLRQAALCGSLLWPRMRGRGCSTSPQEIFRWPCIWLIAATCITSRSWAACIGLACRALIRKRPNRRSSCLWRARGRCADCTLWQRDDV